MRINELPDYNIAPPNHCKPAETKDDFGKMLSSALKEVNNAINDSGEMVSKFAKGEPVEIHQVVLAMERASVALQLTVQVRNKLIEAYDTISKMQV